MPFSRRAFGKTRLDCSPEAFRTRDAYYFESRRHLSHRHSNIAPIPLHSRNGIRETDMFKLISFVVYSFALPGVATYLEAASPSVGRVKSRA